MSLEIKFDKGALPTPVIDGVGLECIGFTAYTFTTSAQGLPSLPSEAAYAVIYVESGSLRITEDGSTTPTTGVGVLAQAGEIVRLGSWRAIPFGATWSAVSQASRYADNVLSVVGDARSLLPVGAWARFAVGSVYTYGKVERAEYNGTRTLLTIIGEKVPSGLTGVSAAAALSQTAISPLQNVKIAASAASLCQIHYYRKAWS